MVPLGSQLKSVRQDHNLTQMDLAQRAGVSLATIQNVESNRGNPELKTIERIAAQLGLEARLVQKALDRSALEKLNLPLFAKTSSVVRVRTRTALLATLAELAPALFQISDPREERALASFLFALRDHFGSTWAYVDVSAKRWLEDRSHLLKDCVKLRRICISQLAEYL